MIIPALNPDERLRDIIDQNWDMKNQIILVNDGSDIEYMPLFAELGEKCIVLHHRENRGKGEAIKTALRYIKSELWECSVIGLSLIHIFPEPAIPLGAYSMKSSY